MPSFIDESFRSQAGVYVVGIAMAGGDLAELALQTRSMLPRHVPRFHWRNDSDAVREKVISLVNQQAIGCRAYVVRRVAKQERARALCLDRFLWDDKQAGDHELVFETRQERNDKQDRAKIIHAQQRRVASEALRYRFEYPQQEPLLWLADAVAGAVAWTLAGEGDYVALFARGMLTIVEQPPSG